jgi:hypothetical protein
VYHDKQRQQQRKIKKGAFPLMMNNRPNKVPYLKSKEKAGSHLDFVFNFIVIISGSFDLLLFVFFPFLFSSFFILYYLFLYYRGIGFLLQLTEMIHFDKTKIYTGGVG